MLRANSPPGHDIKEIRHLGLCKSSQIELEHEVRMTNNADQGEMAKHQSFHLDLQYLRMCIQSRGLCQEISTKQLCLRDAMEIYCLRYLLLSIGVQ